MFKEIADAVEWLQFIGVLCPELKKIKGDMEALSQKMKGIQDQEAADEIEHDILAFKGYITNLKDTVSQDVVLAGCTYIAIKSESKEHGAEHRQQMKRFLCYLLDSESESFEHKRKAVPEGLLKSILLEEIIRDIKLRDLVNMNSLQGITRGQCGV